MKNLSNMTFEQIRKMTDEDARAALEAIRWPTGVECPRCGGNDVLGVAGGRPGLYRCHVCRKNPEQKSDQFSVTVGTIFEDSHIPLGKWIMAYHLMCASKKGVSALQLQRQLELGSYRSAWHMAHRIRHAMKSGPGTPPLSGIVEVDETYVGGKPRNRGRASMGKVGRGTDKAPVVAMIERDGRIKAVSPQKLGGGNLAQAVVENIHKDSTLMTDEYNVYNQVGKQFKGGHHTVTHSKRQYARRHKGMSVHVNTCESWFALLKRGVHGTFHHVERQHLGRYCDEFEFRWDHRKTTDADRTNAALQKAPGKRLMYRDLVGKMSV